VAEDKIVAKRHSHAVADFKLAMEFKKIKKGGKGMK
jgi:hypothetical protein